MSPQKITFRIIFLNKNIIRLTIKKWCAILIVVKGADEMTNVQIENGKKRYQFAELERGDFFICDGMLYIKAKNHTGKPEICTVQLNSGEIYEFEPNCEVELVNDITLAIR